ncbi:hypothetical protein [Tenacibaculum maritimum]|uniref:hypothetical protein n=2 Tax=Tenacibaculum maritimum TaxID=107401 RepID=UPI0012E4ECFE|nr:hypothetical protein [Tenacibaculum maritimum]CAA0217624.1 hypothetical protein CVI1001048_310004 [Tenacibaculum maritimum]
MKKLIFLTLIILIVSCKKYKRKEPLKEGIHLKEFHQEDVNNLPFGNKLITQHDYSKVDWFEEDYFKGFGYFELKKLSSKSDKINFNSFEEKKTFYLPNNVLINYREKNKVNSSYGLLFSNEVYQLYFAKTKARDLSGKVYKEDSDETERGYLVTVKTKDKKVLSHLEILNITEYFTQNYKGTYLGAMFLRNEKMFYIDEKMNIYIYTYMVKAHDLISQYKLLSFDKFKINDKGFFQKSTKNF